MKPEIISSCQIILGNSYPCFNKQLFFKPWDLAASTAGFRRDSALLFDHAWVSWLSKSTVARYGPPMIPSDIGALPTKPTGAPQHLVWHIVDKDVWYLQELDEVGEHWVFSLWASFIFGWDHQEKNDLTGWLGVKAILVGCSARLQTHFVGEFHIPLLDEFSFLLDHSILVCW
jgi:hypothetical protein